MFVFSYFHTFILVDYLLKCFILSITHQLISSSRTLVLSLDRMLNVVQIVQLVESECKLIECILVLRTEKGFKLFQVHVLIVDLVDIGFTQINNVCLECIAEHLIVHVDWPLGNCEESSLTDVVFEPEIVVVEDAFKVERILFWEYVS